MHSGGLSGAVSVKRLANVEIKCPSALNPPGPCGSLPCQNGIFFILCVLTLMHFNNFSNFN